MIRLLILTILLACSQLVKAQSYIYQYVDPCTKNIKFISVPLSGAAIAVTYYGQVGTFTNQDFNNGNFTSWLNQTSGANAGRPCDQATTQAVTTTNLTITNNIISTLTNITSISTMAASLSANVASASSMVGGNLGNTVNNGSTGNGSGNGGSGDNKNRNNSNGNSGNNSNNSSSSASSSTGNNQPNTSGQGSSGSGSVGSTNNQGNGTTSNNNTGGSTGSSGNAGSGNSGGGTGTGQSGGGSSSSGTGTGSGSGGSSQGGGSSSQPPVGGNPGSTGGTGTGSNGSTNGGGNGSTGGTGGAGGAAGGLTQSSTGGGNGGTTNSVSNAAEATSSGSTSTEGGSSGGSGGGSKNGDKNRARTGALIGTGDIVAVRSAEEGEGDQFRFTMSMTKSNTKNTFARGFLGNFTTQINNSNVTIYGAWTLPKSKTTIITANSSMINFSKDFFNTTTLLGSKRFTKLSLMGGLNFTLGNIGETKFQNLSAVGGGFYLFNAGKKVTGTFLLLGVYSPFTQFYEGQWWSSGLLLVPFSSWDYSITKKFKFNISFSGTYELNKNMLNYQLLTGGKVML